METKKYWQAVDKKDETYLFPLEKPRFNDGMLRCSSGVSYIHFLFPIPLKPLQIAEITVCDDGTWSYEIERQEGWYMCVSSDKGNAMVCRYRNSEWYHYHGGIATLGSFTISQARIPDECII